MAMRGIYTKTNKNSRGDESSDKTRMYWKNKTREKCQ
jgi:hypothetical protein